MRFSVASALCVAPLALAGTLQADLFARGALGLEVRSDKAAVQEKASSAKASTSNSKSGSTQVTQITQSTTEDVIIIWVNEGGGAATSTVTNTVTVTAAAAAGGATAAGVAVAAAQATHTVVVGGTAGLVYVPDTITAAVGDMVVFSFLSTNHTATQSAFATPCEALAGGMDSGFVPNINSSTVPAPQIAMQVTVATPIWFYCKQAGHCGKGMVFSINPTANKTQAMFAQMAIAQNGTGTTAAIAGGAASAAAVSATTVATAAAAAATAGTASTSSTAGTGVVAGTGTILVGGSCSCSVQCGVAAFPNAAVQGVGAFGGVSGAIAMSSLTI